ncbi:hypothetical protein [Tychonema sp. BBK16]|uniref:hypothetical protein n=1 Tax=Tychonema sp. BBK16 TaxID=2699888 RepID=UPI0038D323BA
MKYHNAQFIAVSKDRSPNSSIEKEPSGKCQKLDRLLGQFRYTQTPHFELN